MRIFFLVDQMAMGGAGRVASILIKGLFDKGHTIALETDIAKGLFYKIPEEIEIFERIQNKGCLNRLICHRNYINKFKPDVIVAFLPSMFLDIWIASIGLNIPIIASDHTSMSRDLGRWTNFLRHHFYAFAKKVTILTNKDARYLGKRLKNKVVVYNPLTFEPISNYCSANREKKILVVGRLQHWRVKGIDRIIQIWSNLHEKFPNWTLEIAGPGDNDAIEQISNLISMASVDGSVKLLGNIENIRNLYQNTSIFALPSRVEGFPMALTEAMSQGCACIAFSLEGAIDEIISHNKDGIIVEDNNLSEFEMQLSRLISDHSLRDKIAQEAILKVERFSENIFINNWDNLLSQAIL